MPSCSHACSVPVRPIPHITSSRISRTAVAIADFAHRLEIAGNGQQRARRGAADRLGDERDHAPLAALADRRVELGREPSRRRPRSLSPSRRSRYA